MAIARRVAPRATAWLAVRRGAAPSFADVLRRVEEHGDLPDPAPESDPARLLLMYPDLARVPVREVEISGPHGPVPGRVYLADGPPAAGLVWIHGGGFISGTLDFAESNWVGLALARRGIAVLALDYRKALRGTRYPVPLDDVAAGWQWAAEHAAGSLGVGAGHLHLGGASAGGALAAGLAKRLRDTGEAPQPRTQVLAYPVLHASADAFPAAELARLRKRSPYPLLSVADRRLVAENYVGTAEALTDPYAFPANGPLGGLPPAYVLTAEFDMLRFSGEAYAAALRRAGCAVTIEMEPRAPHGALARPSGEFGHRSLDRVAAWLLGGHGKKDQ
jgi:acetyl esterase/lipase